jgi:hypothetical protein
VSFRGHPGAVLSDRLLRCMASENHRWRHLSDDRNGSSDVRIIAINEWLAVARVPMGAIRGRRPVSEARQNSFSRTDRAPSVMSALISRTCRSPGRRKRQHSC